MSDNLLEVKDLRVTYRSNGEVVQAVNGISFDLKPGECLGLVGETGAGKTTTALSILRLLPEKTGFIDNGSIVMEGESLLDVPISKMREEYRGNKISMVFQDPMTSLNPVMTVGDQIAEVLVYHNKDKLSKKDIEQQVEKSLELVGIPSGRKNEYPHQFSGGMKQRVVIAMALACKPDLLIADEPTTALDVTIQAQVLAMMCELREKMNTSMIMITHDFGIVAQICDKVAVMYAGELVEQGSVEDIFEREIHHPYTEGLFNAIPNLDKETDRLVPINGLIPDPSNLPQGCYFAPRCPHCMEICKKEHPGEYVNGSHRIACHLYTGKDQ